MKKRGIPLLIGLLLFITSCTAVETALPASAPSSPEGQTSTDSLLSTDSIQQESKETVFWQEKQPLPWESWEAYAPILNQMRNDQSLYQSWETTPPIFDPEKNYAVYVDFDVVSLEQEENIVTLVVAHYNYQYLHLPMPDRTDNAYWDIAVSATGTPHAPLFAVAESTVQLRLEHGWSTPISCTYTAYAPVVIPYLKAATAHIQPLLDASPKLDIEQYDPKMVSFIWRTLSSYRWIEKPADITLYDLESFQHPLSIYPYDLLEEWETDVKVDAALLRKMTALKEVEIYCRLKDYSVFEGHNQLSSLTLSGMDDADIATLKVGQVQNLHLTDPSMNMLDLSGVNAEALHLFSWSTAVGGFRGCEQIQRFHMNATRTDTALINATNFPNVQYLHLDFYSDTPRVRNFSGLTTFGDDVVIDLALDYFACNNDTLTTLKGAKIRDLYLTPDNGSVIGKIDQTLVDAIPATNIYYEVDPHFYERTQ